MARLQLLNSGGSAVTPISNVFIEHYMPYANPIFSLIYIYTYKRLANDGRPVETGELADAFNILESDVVNAWKYWESKGLVKMEARRDALGIAFHEPQEKNYSGKTIKSNDAAGAANPASEPKSFLDSRVDYPVEELEYIQNQNEEIRGLFAFAEESLGRTLKYNDLNLLYGLHDWLRLPVPVVEKLIGYCAQNGHTHMNYIETVAVNWRENGVDSIKKAEDFIQLFNTGYRRILKAFGQSRNPAPKEIEYMEKWLRNWNMPLDIALEACDKTIMALGKPNFKYADSILENWYKSGVKTLDGVKGMENDFEKNKAVKTGKRTARKKPAFDNFTVRQIDFDQIEVKEKAYIDEMVNGAGDAGKL